MAKKKIATIGIWTLSKVTETGAQPYYFIKGKILGNTVEDYPKLEVANGDSWVSFRYPVNVPPDVRHKVHEHLFSLYKNGKY
jgi:hypothetical protein